MKCSPASRYSGSCTATGRPATSLLPCCRATGWCTRVFGWSGRRVPAPGGSSVQTPLGALEGGVSLHRGRSGRKLSIGPGLNRAENDRCRVAAPLGDPVRSRICAGRTRRAVQTADGLTSRWQGESFRTRSPLPRRRVSRGLALPFRRILPGSGGCAACVHPTRASLVDGKRRVVSRRRRDRSAAEPRSLLLAPHRALSVECHAHRVARVAPPAQGDALSTRDSGVTVGLGVEAPL